MGVKVGTTPSEDQRTEDIGATIRSTVNYKISAEHHHLHSIQNIVEIILGKAPRISFTFFTFPGNGFVTN